MERRLDLRSEDVVSCLRYILLIMLYAVEMWTQENKWPERPFSESSGHRVFGKVVDLECQLVKLVYVGSQILITGRAWEVESQPRNVGDFRESLSAEIAWRTSPLYAEPCPKGLHGLLWVAEDSHGLCLLLVPGPLCFPDCPTYFSMDILSLHLRLIHWKCYALLVPFEWPFVYLCWDHLDIHFMVPLPLIGNYFCFRLYQRQHTFSIALYCLWIILNMASN